MSPYWFHKREAAAIALKEAELYGKRGALRDEVGLAALRDLDETFAAERAAHQLVGDALHVQQTDQVVELALVHRQAGVRVLAQLVEDVLPAVVHVDPGDLLARDHDVVHGDAPEIEYREQHLPMARGNHRGRFAHDRAQLFGAERLRRGDGRPPDAREPEEAVGEGIGEPKRRPGDEDQHPVDARGMQRHPLGVRCGVDLGCELAEHDDDDREEGDRNGHGISVPGALRNDGGDGGGERAGRGENHQVRAEPLIGPRQQPLECHGRR